MKNSRLIFTLLALCLALPFTVATGQAQQQPSAKATAKTSSLTLIPETTGTGDWVTVLCNNIKTPNKKDLFVTASFEVAAASFSYVAVDVPVGVHTVCVQARVDTDGTGDFRAFGAVGKGTLTVEEVRLIKGEDVVAVE